MTFLVLLILAFAAVVPGFVLGWFNLCRYRRSPSVGTATHTSVSICIPARNEASNIEACVRSALAAGDVEGAPKLEVLVYDDQSDDGTPEILQRLAAEDSRVRLVPTEPLPDGWNGKQHACERMGRSATTEWLLFTDADVRFKPDVLRRSMLAQVALKSDLISTVPHEETGSIGELMLIPLINWVLLCYLPFGMMRRSLRPSASAAVGQFILCRRSAWEHSGGHAAFRDTMHDGVKMPRAFRTAGHRTDLFDGTDLVSCRMYQGFKETWQGFAKNAYEGLGSMGLLIMVTVLHVVGHLMPWALLAWALADPSLRRVGILVPLLILLCMPFLQRAIMAWRFRQAPLGVLLHPISIACLIGVQWWSYKLDRTGNRHWRGRNAFGVPVQTEHVSGIQE